MTKSLFTLLNRRPCVSRIDLLLGVLLIVCFLLTSALAYGEKRRQYSKIVEDRSLKVCATQLRTTSILKDSDGGRNNPEKNLQRTRHFMTPVSDPFMDGGGTLLSLMFTVNTKDTDLDRVEQTSRRDQRVGMRKIEIMNRGTVRAPNCAVDFRS